MKLIFCGDISMNKKETEALFAQQNAQALFNDICGEYAKADRVIVNLECAVTDKDTPIKKLGPNLKAPFGTVETLKKAGVTDCALSNNHIFDFGKPGLEDTIAELEKNGVSYTGIGENVQDARKDMIIEKDGKKVAIINVCDHEYSYALEDRVGAREFDPFETADDIAEAKKHADYVILVYHGGKEHCRYPSTRQVKMCRSMVRRGADVVLCQHTHCVGCYEEFEGGHILYGQGNFHFVWEGNASEEWNEGLMVAVDLTDGCKVELIPTLVDGAGIRLANEEEKKKTLDGIKERSKTLVDGSYKKYFAEFCRDPKLAYYRFVEKALPERELERFAHYLDCEAHYDVWKELYKTYNYTNEKE